MARKHFLITMAVLASVLLATTALALVGRAQAPAPKKPGGTTVVTKEVVVRPRGGAQVPRTPLKLVKGGTQVMAYRSMDVEQRGGVLFIKGKTELVSKLKTEAGVI